jgi:acyl-CoA synthetase (NDP forming)
VLVNLQAGGYSGRIYPVNPAYGAVAGHPCFPSLSDLPEVPQQVIFAVADRHVEALVDEAIALGVKACTIFSSLQLPADSLPNLQTRIRRKTEMAGILLHGANCMGFYNFRDGVRVSGFDTRVHSKVGGVSLLSQSGAGMSGILDCEQRLDFNFAASTGLELGVGMEDYLDFVLDLPETRVVGLFLETSRHPDRFIAALDKARRRRIPVIAIKVGKTARSAELAISHSGALAGSDGAYQAVFDYYGVQRVEDMAQLATALIMFAQPMAVAAGGLVSLHDSGGERQLVIDLAEQYDVPLATLAPATVSELEKILDPGLPAVNPLDAWGSGGSGAGETMQQCFQLMLEDPDAAMGAVIHDRAPEGQVYPAYIDYLRVACKAAGKPVFLVANHQGSGADERVLTATREGLPVIDGLSEFLAGTRCLLGHRDFLLREPGDVPVLDAARLAHWHEVLSTSQAVSEACAGELLSDFGIPLVEGRSVDSKEQLLGLVGQLDYPVVLKTAMPEILHKSERGGVVLGLASAEALLGAYEVMAAKLGPLVFVVPMVEEEGVEMLLGVARDCQFGPTVVLGIGGVYTEVLQDAVMLLPPFDSSVARRALDSLKLRPLLDEFRGRAAVDIEAFCDSAAILSVLALELADSVVEIEVNPMKVTSIGCFGLDALLIPKRFGGSANGENGELCENRD